MTVATYRVLCAVAVLAIPLAGVLAEATTAGAHDPMALRLLISAGFVAAFAASFAERFLGAFIRAMRGMCYVLASWTAWLVAVNPEHPWYVAASCCIYAMLAIVFGLGTRRVLPVALFVSYGFAANALVLTLAPPAHIATAPLLTALAAVSAALYLASAGRARTVAALRRREASALQAQRIAGVGTWEWDRASGEVRFSDELYRMLGHTRETLRPTLETLYDLVHPDDVTSLQTHETISQALEAAGRGGQPRPYEVRLLRLGAPGEAPPPPMWARVMIHAETAGDGHLAWAQGTLLDISEHKAHQQALEAAAAAAEEARARTEEAARLQQAFLANMSHEIRTPLTAILGFARLLREDASPEQELLLSPIEQSGDRLQRTLEAILDLAQVESGRLALELHAFDLRAAAREAAAPLRAAAAKKGLAFTVDLPEAPVWCHGDPEAVRRICFHLLDNAVKFTEHGGVTARFGHEGGRPTVTVEDTGIGMDPAMLPRLFQPFRQASTGFARSYEGSGLGLTLAHRLATLMGASLGVESAKGHGCVFTLAMPAAAPPHTAEPHLLSAEAAALASETAPSEAA